MSWVSLSNFQIRRVIFEDLKFIVDLKFEEGEINKLAIFLAASESLREELGISIKLIDREPRELAIEKMRSELGEEEFDKAWAKGRAMTLEQAIELALRE